MKFAPNSHSDHLLARAESNRGNGSGNGNSAKDGTNPCDDFAVASFDLVLSRIAAISDTNQNIVLLKLAERCLEHAGYGSAGTLHRNDVVELMLYSAKVGKFAKKLGPCSLHPEAKVKCNVE